MWSLIRCPSREMGYDLKLISSNVSKVWDLSSVALVDLSRHLRVIDPNFGSCRSEHLMLKLR